MSKKETIKDESLEEMKSIKFPKKLVKEINSLGDSFKPVNFSQFIREAAQEKITKEKKK